MADNIRIQQLRFSYDKQFELQVDELLIDKGEIFGLLGPSGSGKTTLINILTKEITNYQGIVEISGKSLDKLDFSKIGVLTDQNNLYGNLTLEENFTFFSKIKEADTDLTSEIIDILGLTNHLNKRFSKCSSGMKKRAMLIVAIINNPEVLFLDEPTNGLDPIMKQKVYSVLLKLKSNGTIIFLSTHDMLEAEFLCSGVAFIKSGSIIASGTIEQFKQKSMEINGVLKTKTKNDETNYFSLEELGMLLGQENELVSIELTTFSLNNLFLNFMETGGVK